MTKQLTLSGAQGPTSCSSIYLALFGALGTPSATLRISQHPENPTTTHSFSFWFAQANYGKPSFGVLQHPISHAPNFSAQSRESYQAHPAPFLGMVEQGMHCHGMSGMVEGGGECGVVGQTDVGGLRAKRFTWAELGQVERAQGSLGDGQGKEKDIPRSMLRRPA